MKLSDRQVLLSTLAYSDIFDFPLTKEELLLWSIKKSVRAIPHKFTREYKHDIYYSFPEKKSCISKRKQRAKYALEKWPKAKRIAHILSYLPTIELIGVSGALAMNNTERDDDIDFFVVCRSHTIWATRLGIALMLTLLRMRRTVHQQAVRDAICVNMMVSTDALAIPANEQDLFAAHEVLQMVPVFDRGGVYQDFLHANQWTKLFLPNAWKTKCTMNNVQCTISENLMQKILHFTLYILHFLEFLFRFLQLQYMKNHRTTEVVTDDVLRFHPHDARVWIKKKLQKKLQKFNIPLDSVFYAS